MNYMSKFECGTIVATRGVADRVKYNNDFRMFVMASFKRYFDGDWGDLDPWDWEQTENAVKNGNDRIFAAYDNPKYGKIWIITEADRSMTAVLFPDEY